MLFNLAVFNEQRRAMTTEKMGEQAVKDFLAVAETSGRAARTVQRMPSTKEKQWEKAEENQENVE